jgi:O-glycosyl hydrolase
MKKLIGPLALSGTTVALIIPAFYLSMQKSPENGISIYSPTGLTDPGNQVSVFVSSLSGDRMTKYPELKFTQVPEAASGSITIDETVKYQKMEGFGATFNEAGMICLNDLESSSRDSVLRNLFDPVVGAGYTLMKSPIAACDFASAGPWYSYDDNPGDIKMLKFSIERDLQPNGLIPFIKSASKFGKFRIESPMDFAPDWMLYSLKQGEKNVRKEYYPALAAYYSKYIREYAKNGVTIDFLNPFNEPQNTWYSNETYKAIGVMVKDFIVPRFKADGIKTKIQLCETSNRPEAIMKLPDALNDPAVRKNVSALTVHGYDWDQFAMLTKLHKAYPEIPIWQTEVCYASLGNVPENGPKSLPVYEYQDGEFWGNMIMNDMRNRVSAWLYWNMILDENGGPWLVSKEHGDGDNNVQHPVVIINRKTKKVTYTGLYYYLAHFSKFIRPGAYRIQSIGNQEQLNYAAFVNTDGTIILNIINNGDLTDCSIVWKKMTIPFHVAAHSISTLKWKI